MRSMNRFSLLYIAFLFVLAHSAVANEINGRATVVDGDTLIIGTERIRLHGIDAPERAQRCLDFLQRSYACGETATSRLRQLVRGSSVNCVSTERDRYGRAIARCWSNGREINKTLVTEGLAWAFVRYSSDYVNLEAEARAAGRGVFQSANMPAWEFRAQAWQSTPLPPSPQNSSTQAQRDRCPIKGNVNRRGERIYHMPWQRDYRRIVMNERRGKQWFCSENEALAAGWRPAIR